jgi:glycerol-3-phosphate dehydrogenase
MRTRQARIEYIQTHPEPVVLIIGAGINGIGVFLDLALQGIPALLIDREDYCSGASAASSHMLHGGIRYLEYGETRLVREALAERNHLLHNAPHLAKPLPTTIPLFSRFSGLLNAPLKFLGLRKTPEERGALLVRLGLMLYDGYAGKDNPLPKHSFADRAQALAQFPRLNPEIVAAATYHDAAMPSPERIAIELIADAEKECEQAVPLNYARITQLDAHSVTIQDQISGSAFTIKPRFVVNATGAWIDGLNRQFGETTHYISGSKGSHIVLDHAELLTALNDHEFFFENQDGRIVLLYPLEDRVLVGTTDIPAESPDDARISSQEVDYLLGMVARVFPDISIEKKHIVYTFSGVRPLRSSHTDSPGAASRDHQLHIDEPGPSHTYPILSLAGGKWTTYRAFAAQTIDEILARMEIPRVCSTATWRIGGGHEYPENAIARDQFLWTQIKKAELEKEQGVVLFERYGTRLKHMVNAVGPVLAQPLQYLPEFSVGEIQFFTNHEDPQHLDDLVFRRTNIAKRGRITPQSLAEIAGIMADTLKWDSQRKAEEIARVEKDLDERHAMTFNRYNG